jgi:metallo-beta-lactamase family protein
VEIEFYGAAGEVTGSCHILRVAGRQLLIDCGMIQGGSDASARNRQPFPFEPGAIDAVFLTHAHLDHCGRLPLLVQRGFRGPIYTNSACRDLLPILLRDSADLAAREVERINRRREPGEPAARALYDGEDVDRCLQWVRALRYDTDYAPLPGVSLRIREAGHILGSSSLEFELQEGELRRRVIFSGDLGQYDSPILQDPHDFTSADLVVMECTYGDRLHRERADTLREISGIIARAAADGGNIVIPAFAVGRSQELLYLLGKHHDEWQLGDWQIFLDSPMAIEASEIYWRHVDRHDSEAVQLRASFASMPALPNLSLTRSVDESRAINRYRSHALIIAGSGMCNGGRVLHHLARNLPRPECHVIFTGYQAPGTLGRSLVDGATRVRIYGEDVPVRAVRHTVGGLSAHGDQADLLRWYGSLANRPMVCLVHGEPEPAAALKRRLHALDIRTFVPRSGDIIDLVANRTRTHDAP